MKSLLSKNEETARFGLVLTEDDAIMVADSLIEDLREQERVELAGGIAPKIIDTFCDSPYLMQDSYADTLCELQSAFYQYKGESDDLMSDDELLTLMRECFDEICNGDTDYLTGTCLERFAQAVRCGFDGYHATGGSRVYWMFDEETRWDYELYLETLRNLDML